MSLYNLLHGENGMSTALLTLLDLTRDQIPRYRDCYWSGDCIVIYTRTGGGNRDYYDVKNDDNPEGPWNEDLRKHPCYLRDEDDDFDSTYAYFYFKAPEQYKEFTDSLAAAKTPGEKFDEVMKMLQSPNAMDDPRFKRVKEAMEPIMKKITEGLK